jgi:hypothetical protein
MHHGSRRGWDNRGMSPRHQGIIGVVRAANRGPHQPRLQEGYDHQRTPYHPPAHLGYPSTSSPSSLQHPQRPTAPPQFTFQHHYAPHNDAVFIPPVSCSNVNLIKRRESVNAGNGSNMREQQVPEGIQGVTGITSTITPPEAAPIQFQGSNGSSHPGQPPVFPSAVHKPLYISTISFTPASNRYGLKRNIIM